MFDSSHRPNFASRSSSPAKALFRVLTLSSSPATEFSAKASAHVAFLSFLCLLIPFRFMFISSGRLVLRFNIFLIYYQDEIWRCLGGFLK